MRKTYGHFLEALAIAATLLTAIACHNSPKKSLVEGHYTYQHGWNYDIKEGHIDVHETGTMDFFPDGSALDSARQVYSVLLKEGGKLTYVFNYISPSRWHVDKTAEGKEEGGDFYFSGIEDSFRMELVESAAEGCESSTELADRIIGSVSSSIGRETKFHLFRLTPDELVWSYLYPDGHTDYWEFYKTDAR